MISSRTVYGSSEVLAQFFLCYRWLKLWLLLINLILALVRETERTGAARLAAAAAKWVWTIEIEKCSCIIMICFASSLNTHHQHAAHKICKLVFCFFARQIVVLFLSDFYYFLVLHEFLAKISNSRSDAIASLSLSLECHAHSSSSGRTRFSKQAGRQAERKFRSNIK